MLNHLLNLIEHMTKLFEIREKNRQEYFQQHVQPTYDTAEAIYRDYRNVLRELRKMVEHAGDPEPIIAFLEQRREQLLPERDRLRALVAKRVQEGRGTRFEAGVLGLMTGAVAAMDIPYYRTVSYEEDNGSIWIQPSRHTVLDILQRLKALNNQDLSSDRERERVLRAVDRQIEAIEQAWQNVVRGYADLHASTLPAIKVREGHRLSRHSGIKKMRELLEKVKGMIKSRKFDRKPATDLEKVGETVKSGVWLI